MSHQPNRSFIRLTISLTFIVTFALVGCADTDGHGELLSSTAEALSSRMPTVPPELAVPAGNKLDFVLGAEGVQIYDCKAPADGSFAWVFRAPEADLFDRRGSVDGSHYAGPTWEALDGSTVVGARVASVTVDASAIPWLLLQATSRSARGRMANVTFIQRLSTRGGLAPSSGCNATLARAVAEVPYTASYAFYEASCGRGQR
jgi:hypothetical protein